MTGMISPLCSALSPAGLERVLGLLVGFVESMDVADFLCLLLVAF